MKQGEWSKRRKVYITFKQMKKNIKVRERTGEKSK